MEAFTFGEPVPVLDRRDILDYVRCISNRGWYEPRSAFTGLAKNLRAAVHLAHRFTSNVIFWLDIYHIRGFSQQDFSRFVLDFLVFGNAFLEKRYNAPPVDHQTGNLTGKNIPAVAWRGCVYWWVPSLQLSRQPSRPANCFLLEPDIVQELYGLPEYLSALNSAAE